MAAHRTKSIVSEIKAAPTEWGAITEVFSQLVPYDRGWWFYAGWVDQASLHVGRTLVGDVRLAPSMLRQFDLDQVGECGDMIVGFVPNDEDLMLAIEVSAERGRFTISLRSRDEEGLTQPKRTLGL